MASKIIFQNQECTLIDEFTDIGYMADNFEASTINNETIEVKRSHHDKAMTLLLSFPEIFLEHFIEEIKALDSLLSKVEVPLYAYLIFAKPSEEIMALQAKLQKLQIVFDTFEEFGPIYGTQIVSGTLKGSLAKSLFLISKDGAIFYIDMPLNVEDPINIDRLTIELNKAYTTYNGMGCHG